MLVGSRPFPYLATKKKSCLLSISGEPIHFVALGDPMHARQQSSLWWLRSQVYVLGKLRAYGKSMSIVVHLGTLDVMLVWMVAGDIDTCFFLYSGHHSGVLMVNGCFVKM
jgi:hypothetical protein